MRLKETEKRRFTSAGVKRWLMSAGTAGQLCRWLRETTNRDFHIATGLVNANFDSRSRQPNGIIGPYNSVFGTTKFKGAGIGPIVWKGHPNSGRIDNSPLGGRTIPIGHINREGCALLRNNCPPLTPIGPTAIQIYHGADNLKPL